LYNDPYDYAPFGTTLDQVYNQKWYMPPSGAQRGSTLVTHGDPLTPIYPATGMRISTIFNESTFFLIYRLHV
jgi:hypothetical protein